MISKEEFIRKCDELIPKEEMEEYNKCKKKMWKALLITLLVEILIIWGIYYIWEPIIVVGLAVICISIVIVVVTCKYQWTDFKNRYSKGVMDVLFEGYEFSYNPQDYIKATEFKNSCFNTDYDNYFGEDLLKVVIPNDDGTPSHVVMKICDLKLTKNEERQYRVKSSSGGYITRTEVEKVTVYEGVFGQVLFPFQFKCDLSINVNHKWYKRIKLEDVNFNKLCKVYTNEHLEALVILTPTLMNKIKAFAERVKGFKICIMKNGNMYFGMKRNMFELSSAHKKPTGKVFERFYNDVRDILAMVDEIKTNNKVFKI